MLKNKNTWQIWHKFFHRNVSLLFTTDTKKKEKKDTEFWKMALFFSSAWKLKLLRTLCKSDFKKVFCIKRVNYFFILINFIYLLWKQKAGTSILAQCILMQVSLYLKNGSTVVCSINISRNIYSNRDMVHAYFKIRYEGKIFLLRYNMDFCKLSKALVLTYILFSFRGQNSAFHFCSLISFKVQIHFL